MGDIQEKLNEAQKLFNAGRYANAYEIWTTHVSSVAPSHTGSLHSNRAQALLQLGRASEALECCAAALALEPALPTALRGRTAALLKLEDVAGALTSAEAGAALLPGQGTLRADVALCQLRSGRAQEAVASCEAAMELGDKSEATRRLYGNALSSRASDLSNEGQLGAAEALLDAAIAIEPSESRLFNRALLCHTAALQADEKDSGAKHTKKALTDLRAVVSLNKAHPKAHGLMGILLLRAGKWEWSSARAALATACSINPTDTQDLFNLGFVSLKLSLPAEAKELFERALALKPDMAEAAEGLREAMEQLQGGKGSAAAPSPSGGGSGSPPPAESASDPAKYFTDPSRSAADFEGYCGAVHPLLLLQREPYPAGVERGSREAYLSAQEFKGVFGADKAAWYAQPKWKRDGKKKDSKLF
jgi:tetratricopeptide (TPR) repeat protein